MTRGSSATTQTGYYLSAPEDEWKYYLPRVANRDAQCVDAGTGEGQTELEDFVGKDGKIWRQVRSISKGNAEQRLGEHCVVLSVRKAEDNVCVPVTSLTTSSHVERNNGLVGEFSVIRDDGVDTNSGGIDQQAVPLGPLADENSVEFQGAPQIDDDNLGGAQ